MFKKRGSRKSSKHVQNEAEGNILFRYKWQGDTLFVEGAKRTLAIIFKNGISVKVKCDSYKITRRFLGGVKVRSIEGISKSCPIYLRMSQIAAIIED